MRSLEGTRRAPSLVAAVVWYSELPIARVTCHLYRVCARSHSCVCACVYVCVCVCVCVCPCAVQIGVAPPLYMYVCVCVCIWGVHDWCHLGALRALVAAATGWHGAGTVAEGACDEHHLSRRRHRVVHLGTS